MRHSPATFVFLLTPPLMWASNAVLGRLAVGAATPLASPLLLNALRWAATLALVLLALAVVGAALTRAQRDALRRDWPLHLLLGALSVAGYNALLYSALQTTSPINATLIVAGGPLFALVIGRLLFGAQATRWAWIGAFVSIAGVAVVLSGGEPARLAALGVSTGDALVLFATLTWALYSWLLRKRRPDLPPLVLLAVQCVWGLVVSAPVVAWEAASGALVVQPGWRTLALVAWIALGPSLIAYLCWDKGVARAGPMLPTFFANLTPLFAALLSLALLGEAPQPYHAIAFALIVGGIALSQRGAKASAEVVPRSS